MQQHYTVLTDIDHLKNYFVSVGQILSSKLPIIENNAKIVSKILIENMRNKKNTGEDGISNEML